VAGGLRRGQLTWGDVAAAFRRSERQHVQDLRSSGQATPPCLHWELPEAYGNHRDNVFSAQRSLWVPTIRPHMCRACNVATLPWRALLSVYTGD